MNFETNGHCLKHTGCCYNSLSLSGTKLSQR